MKCWWRWIEALRVRGIMGLGMLRTGRLRRLLKDFAGTYSALQIVLAQRVYGGGG